MKPRFLRLVSWLAFIATLGFAPAAFAVEDRAIGISSEDQAMKKAIIDARAKLPHFWQIMASPKHGETEFALKVRVADGDAIEHFWCTDIKIEKEIVSGVIGNDAEIVTSVRLGQRITIKEADISDWLYIRDEKMIGNYTVRPLMKSMNQEELAFLKDHLGELPKD